MIFADVYAKRTDDTCARRETWQRKRDDPRPRRADWAQAARVALGRLFAETGSMTMRELDSASMRPVAQRDATKCRHHRDRTACA